MSYGYAAQVVGGALQAAAAGMDQAKMRGKLADEQRAQAEFQRLGQSEFQGGLSFWNPGQVQADMAAGRAQRLGAYSQLGQTPYAFGGNYTDTAQTKSQNAAYNQQQAQHQAALGSYGDWLFTQSIRNLATQRSLNQLTSSATGTANLLPLQLYQAQHSYDWLSQIGALLSSLGTSTQPTTQATAAPSFYQSGGGQPQYQYSTPETAPSGTSEGDIASGVF